MRTRDRFTGRVSRLSAIVRDMGRANPTRSLVKRLHREQIIESDETLIATAWVRFAFDSDSRCDATLFEQLKDRDVAQVHLTTRHWVLELRDGYYYAPLQGSALTPHGARTGRFAFNDNLLFIVAKTDRELRTLATVAEAAMTASRQA